MSNRFVVKHVSDVPELAINSGFYQKDYFWVLVDTETNKIVGTDPGEPEDAILVRDLDWIPFLLNEQQDQLDEVINVLGYAYSCLQGDSEMITGYFKDKAWLEDREKVFDLYHRLVLTKK